MFRVAASSVPSRNVPVQRPTVTAQRVAQIQTAQVAVQKHSRCHEENNRQCARRGNTSQLQKAAKCLRVDPVAVAEAMAGSGQTRHAEEGEYVAGGVRACLRMSNMRKNSVNNEE